MQKWTHSFSSETPKVHEQIQNDTQFAEMFLFFCLFGEFVFWIKYSELNCLCSLNTSCELFGSFGPELLSVNKRTLDFIHVC